MDECLHDLYYDAWIGGFQSLQNSFTENADVILGNVVNTVGALRNFVDVITGQASLGNEGAPTASPPAESGDPLADGSGSGDPPADGSGSFLSSLEAINEGLDALLSAYGTRPRNASFTFAESLFPLERVVTLWVGRITSVQNNALSAIDHNGWLTSGAIVRELQSSVIKLQTLHYKLMEIDLTSLLQLARERLGDSIVLSEGLSVRDEVAKVSEGAQQFAHSGNVVWTESSYTYRIQCLYMNMRKLGRELGREVDK
ncbi:MAG: hypothetical protein LBR89_02790 [Holosporales bacterium]|nr:hypothetical protein [Holosporales bacterium]